MTNKRILTNRSYLFVPGDRPDFLEKADGRGADALIIDLEDAVAPSRKDTARSITTQWLAERDPSSTPAWVRVNDSDADADAARGWEHLAGLMIPKIRTAAELDRWPTGMPLLVLIETASAVRHIDDIATHESVLQLMIGEADLSAEIGVAPDSPVWDVLRTVVVVASVAAEISSPIGPVDPRFESLDDFEDGTRHLKDMGFGARALIHPSQVEPTHRAFQPTGEEIAAARRVLEMHDSALGDGKGAYVDQDGRMLDEAYVRRSRALLNRAESYESDGRGEG